MICLSTYCSEHVSLFWPDVILCYEGSFTIQESQIYGVKLQQPLLSYDFPQDGFTSYFVGATL